jgi:hypothetical protein
MEINTLKDYLFELLNEEAEEIGIVDIDANDRENTFLLQMKSGECFEITCRKV